MSSDKTPNSNIFSSLDLISKSLDAVSERLDRLEKSCLPVRTSDAGKESDKIRLLPGIIEKITASRDLDGVMSGLLESLDCSIERGLVLSLEDGRYTPLKSRGFAQGPEQTAVMLGEAEDLLGTAVNSRQIIIIKGDISKLVSCASLPGRRTGYAMFIPLVFGNQVPLVLYSESGEPPDPDLAESAVSIAGLVIKNQHLTAMLSHDLSDAPAAVDLVPDEETLEDKLAPEAEHPEISDVPEEEQLPGPVDFAIPEARMNQENSRKIFRSVDDFDSDIISAEDLIRSFNIDINGINGDFSKLEEEAGDFLESIEETKKGLSAASASLEELEEEWDESPHIEIELPSGESGEKDSDDDYEEIRVELPDEPSEGGFTARDTSEHETEDRDDESPWEEESPAPGSAALAEQPFAPEEKGDAEEELPEESEEALSFARLLVSEIKLYNEEAVKEGRQNGDLYSRLQEQINLSREVYEARISGETRMAKDYFEDELIRILARGDRQLLNSNE